MAARGRSVEVERVGYQRVLVKMKVVIIRHRSARTYQARGRRERLDTEIADGFLPIFFRPDTWKDAFG